MKVIYIATNPTQESSSYINDAMASESCFVMHPFFDLTSEYGKRTADLFTEEFKSCEDIWENAINKDVWMIKNSGLFVYDMDSDPGHHLIGIALAFGVPMIGLSSEMKGLSDHIFSKKFLAIIKHSNLLKYGLTFAR